MQKTILPTHHHHFDRSSSSTPGKLQPSATSNPSEPLKKMAQLRTAAPRTSFVGAGGAFGNSKFFLKKQNRAATKIQALCRAFLVQARLYRQRVLEPRLQELQDCEARKVEELRRIQEQLQEERQTLPAAIRQEMEASTVLVDKLKEEVDSLTKANERIKEERKEEKRKNKELEQESRQLKDSTFRLDVQNTKLTAEIKENTETKEKYEWAVQDGNSQMDDLEAALLKVCYQQGVLKKYIHRIIKLVDEKAKEHSPPSSPKQRRKSLSKKSLSLKHFNKKDLSSPPNSPKQRRKSVHRHKSHGKVKKRHSIKSDFGHASFNWETYDGNNSKSEIEMSVEDLMAQHPDEEQACFDWATKSYTWGNQSLELEQDVEEPPKEKPRRHSKSSKPQEEAPAEGGERRPRRHSKNNNNKAAKNPLKELVHELKTIKKQLLKQ